MTFNLALLDELDLVDGTVARLEQLTGSALTVHHDYPDEATVATRLKDAEGALVTWRTRVTRPMIEANPQLHFIGLAASAFTDRKASTIDLDACDENGVVVSSLGQYGDEGVAEWVIARALTGSQTLTKWRNYKFELAGKQIGIIGLGHVGRYVARLATAFGMRVVYTGPHEKTDVEYPYLSNDELLATSDVVTIHAGKGASVLSPSDFEVLRKDALLINTSLGPILDTTALSGWLQNPEASFACDICVTEDQRELAASLDNAVYDHFIAGDSVEMRQRKSAQLVENVSAFLEGSPIRVMR